LATFALTWVYWEEIERTMTTTDNRRLFYDLDRDDLLGFVEAGGWPRYRADQLYDW